MPCWLFRQNTCDQLHESNNREPCTEIAPGGRDTTWKSQFCTNTYVYKWYFANRRAFGQWMAVNPNVRIAGVLTGRGLCHQEQPRPRACVVAPAGGGHGPVLSTVRRGPPLPVGNRRPSPGRCVVRALWLRGTETWGECRARRVGGRRRQARGEVRLSFTDRYDFLYRLPGGIPVYRYRIGISVS